MVDRGKDQFPKRLPLLHGLPARENAKELRIDFVSGNTLSYVPSGQPRSAKRTIYNPFFPLLALVQVFTLRMLVECSCRLSGPEADRSHRLDRLSSRLAAPACPPIVPLYQGIDASHMS